MSGKVREGGEMPLDDFLAGFAAEEAATLRRAAERIDAIEREIGPPGWIERHLGRLMLGAFGLFMLGVILLFRLAVSGGGFLWLTAVVLLLAAFPALSFAYLWSVRRRTAADHEKMALNERHFLPRGAVYFGPRDGQRVVLRVSIGKDAPTLKERTERLHAEATRRRWWW